jgi:hypothetical protein
LGQVIHCAFPSSSVVVPHRASPPVSNDKTALPIDAISPEAKGALVGQIARPPGVSDSVAALQFSVVISILCPAKL